MVVINGYEAFIETYPDYYELLIILTRDCIKYGIFFMFTTNVVDGIRFKLRQNFGQNFVLQQISEEDYSQILGNTHKTYPSKCFGRGLIKKDEIYEFQTAYVSQKENISITVNNINEVLIKKYGIISRKVPILPDVVVYDELNIDSSNNTIIGINKSDLKNCTYDFKLDNINLITGLDFSLFETFLNPLLYQFSKNSRILSVVINCEDITIEDEVKQASTYFDSNFDNIFNTLLTFLNNSIEVYNKNNQDKSIFNNRKKIICTIIGPNSFKDKLSDENKKLFDNMFNLGENLDIIDYIFVQTEDKLKSFEYEDWYKNNHSKSNFIWIGSGIQNQYTFNVTTRIPELNEEIPYNFCFVVKKGKPEYVKFIEKIHN